MAGLPAVGQQQILLERVRDPFGTANSQALIFDLFSRLQWAVNAQIEDVVQNAPLPLNARQCTYQINANLPNAMKILGVRDGNKDLYPMPFDKLRGYNRYWFRRTGDYLKWFALCGYDLLVVGPCLDSLQEATNVTAVYTKLTDPIDSILSRFELQNENVQSVMELAEAILLAKARDWEGAQEAMKRAMKTLNLEEMELRDLDTGVPPTLKDTDDGSA